MRTELPALPDRRVCLGRRVQLVPLVRLVPLARTELTAQLDRKV